MPHFTQPPHQAASANTLAKITSRELVLRTLRGLETPRVPTGPLAVHYCAKAGGVSLREYTTNASALATSVVRYYELFHPDAVWISADTWVSAQAMGAVVGTTAEDQPFGCISGPCVRTTADIDRIPPPDVGRQGRYPLMLEALERVRKALGSDVFIVGCFDQYPFSLAAALMGINEIMVKLVEAPSFVEALMERCLAYGLAYGRALSEAGADLLSGGDSPVSLIGPRAYRELALPFERRLIAGLKQTTERPVSLHICGNALPILADMASSGADVLEIDQKVDLEQACRIVDPRVTLWGNLDPVALLANGSPEQVRQEARRAVAIVKAFGRRRFVLSSGCTLAMETSVKNLQALLEPNLTEA
jgi:uroporphyrinogen decarboxylase